MMIPPKTVHLARSHSHSHSHSLSRPRPLTRSPSLPAMHIAPQHQPDARPRPTFHLAVDSSDNEDDPGVLVRAHPPPIRVSSFSERESARRFHALSELLSTELGYLLDLRTLVAVYLRLLPVLKIRSSLQLPHSNPSIPYFSRPPHGINPQSSSLRTQSLPPLSASTCVLHPSETLPSASAAPHSVPARVDKCATRHLFSASDLDTITRNAEEILALHERLVHQLRQVISPFGIALSPTDFLADGTVQSHRNPPSDVHHAITAVSAVFVDHASSFHQYQAFCSGHSEAFDLVRKAQHRYPTEWDAFELRCAATAAAEVHLQDVSGQPIPCSESKRCALDLSHRRHSLPSLDALSSENLKAPTLSASESGHADRDTGGRRPRLMFMDYMIKPVQRVCRYPLLFDQLQERPSPQNYNDSLHDSTRDGQDSVKSALWSMRTIARLVDEARRQQDLLTKSVQIVSRITQGLLASTASHPRPAQSASLSAFLSDLGPCHLSGSLDVIHYRSTNMARLGTVRAKYLGAFLFPGGFLVLVKVAKSKTYEPKHWFSLRGFELVDSNVDDVLLPSWFRLASKSHLFEFAASCRREKDIWVDAMRRAVAEEVMWADEPPSSLQIDYNVPLLEDVQFEAISPLPTIQSIPELNDVESIVPDHLPPPPPPAQRTFQILLNAENLAKPDITRRPLPIPESNTFHLVRSTASAREQVDRGLLDVFSEKCLTARFHAHTHEEDLFEAQKITRSFSRSASALTMASAMSVAAKNRLTKRESVLVPRKKNFLESNGMLVDVETSSSSTLSVAPVKKKQHPSKLKIAATTRTTSYQGDEDGSEPIMESPSPISHCSSVSFATPVTPLPIHPPLTHSGNASSCQLHGETLIAPQKDCPPKRSRSMIENVRGFFVPRSASPTIALTRESSTRSSISSSSLLRWWSRESLRRRVRSAPDVPSEGLPSALTTLSLHVEVGQRPSLATAERPYSQPDLHYLYSETSPAEFGLNQPPQKKGIFSSRGPRRRYMASTLPPEGRDEDVGFVPTRLRRNFSFLQRFTHNTSYDVTPPA